MSEEGAYRDAIDGTFVPVARRGVASVELEGEGLLYDEARGSWHLLSQTAMVIWQCCDGSGTVEELARELAKTFQADFETVRLGTLEAVRQLGREGLLDGLQGDAPGLDLHHAHGRGHQDGAPDEHGAPSA